LDKLIDKQFELNSIDQKFYDYLSEKLAERISAVPPDVVPVVTGFLGPVPGSILTTIGRGYTDLTAALISVGIKADELQIWKEVDGKKIVICMRVCGTGELDFSVTQD
jgi:aspartate kinase